MAEKKQVPIELIAAGEYAVAIKGCPYYIVSTNWGGPQGGRRMLWEVATRRVADSNAPFEFDYLIDNHVPPGETLREARENVAEAMAWDVAHGEAIEQAQREGPNMKEFEADAQQYHLERGMP